MSILMINKNKNISSLMINKKLRMIKTEVKHNNYWEIR